MTQKLMLRAARHNAHERDSNRENGEAAPLVHDVMIMRERGRANEDGRASPPATVARATSPMIVRAVAAF
jgi:hypothetical protein